MNDPLRRSEQDPLGIPHENPHKNCQDFDPRPYVYPDKNCQDLTNSLSLRPDKNSVQVGSEPDPDNFFGPVGHHRCILSEIVIRIGIFWVQVITGIHGMLLS
jgi:hypothetical protein